MEIGDGGNLDLVAGKDLWRWRRWAVGLAAEGGVSAYEVDWLLAAVANLDRLTLRLESIGDKQLVQISMSLDRLSALWLDRVHRRKPVQYLVGTTFWRDFELVVSPAVLIPRPETESTIDIAIAESSQRQQQGIWVDLGTGSGAIAIGLAREFPAARIYAVDYSAAALEIARTNATRLDVLERIEFSQGSWWSSLGHLRGQVAGMLSNPPYIPSEEVLCLQPEVVQHEPHLALDGGLDGLAAIRCLVDTAPEYLQVGGIWLIEMMAGQGETVRDLLTRQGSYTDIQIIPDLAGLDRFVFARVRA
jgi:release factor glutamine methyltransferase